MVAFALSAAFLFLQVFFDTLQTVCGSVRTLQAFKPFAAVPSLHSQTAKQPPLQGYSNEFIISATLSLHKTGFLLVRFKCSFVIRCRAQNNISVMIFFFHKKMSKHNTKAWMQNNTSLCAAAEERSAAPLENIQFFVTSSDICMQRLSEKSIHTIMLQTENEVHRGV